MEAAPNEQRTPPAGDPAISDIDDGFDRRPSGVSACDDSLMPTIVRQPTVDAARGGPALNRDAPPIGSSPREESGREPLVDDDLFRSGQSVRSLKLPAATSGADSRLEKLRADRHGRHDRRSFL